MTDTDIQSKLAECEGIIRMLTEKLEEQMAENARLRSSEAESVSALSTLRMIMRDDSQPANVRVRAATAALACETPSLKPVEPPLELVAEEIIEPLAVVIERQRARCKAMLPPYTIGPDGHSIVLLKGNGHNDGDDSSND
jgi:uncharacterized protein (UPF0147 family)